ncbi:gp64 [Rhodococcus phage ReqiPine5]|uniref:Gp64 n=1 Tax=Rhodococcus phage ReqiPine5 TaxID=691963 RepID=D4P839_9CAUD|nr:gp64 [Rhodococcus phage ReqiPine5]ADD81169.1 gp64 [Rhodococcus phage ReqiPine5]
MIVRRWEVQVRDLRLGGCGFVGVARYFTLRAAVLAAEYRGGRVHDRRHRRRMTR